MTLPASGAISLNNVNVELGLSGTTSINMNQATVRTLFGVASGAISMSDGYGKSNIVVPNGLIVPLYNTTTVPTGWNAFTAADNRMIIGAGSTYSAGGTGGSSTTTVSGGLSNVGAHNPTNSATGSGGGSESSSNTSAGAHEHTFSTSVTSTDVYKTFKLIKCASTQSKLPANAILFGTTSLTGPTNVETTTNRLLMAGTAYGTTGGSATPSAAATSSSNGSHKHGNTSDSGDGDFNQRLGGTVGTHNHSLTINMTLATKKAALSAWTNASAEYNLATNGIALWESATPPTGWYICNGANGTVDLRDYFLFVGTTATQGTRSGNNTASWSITQASFSDVHTHYTTTVGSAPGGSNSHANYAWSHTHTASGTVTVTQLFYALYFIQYGG